MRPKRVPAELCPKVFFSGNRQQLWKVKVRKVKVLRGRLGLAAFKRETRMAPENGAGSDMTVVSGSRSRPPEKERILV